MGKKPSLQEAIETLEETFYTLSDEELYRFVVEAIERPLLEKVLDKTDGNQVQAAKILGINRNTLRSKIRKLGIKIE